MSYETTAERLKLPEHMPFENLDGTRTVECFYRVVGKRIPRKGEWYVSGAVPMAYRASRDLLSPYLIVEPTHRARRAFHFERGEPINLRTLKGT